MDAAILAVALPAVGFAIAALRFFRAGGATASDESTVEETPANMVFLLVMAVPVLLGAMFFFGMGTVEANDAEARSRLELAAALAMGLGGLGATLGMALAVNRLRAWLQHDPRLFSSGLVLLATFESPALFGFVVGYLIASLLGGADVTPAEASGVLQGAAVFGAGALLAGLVMGALLSLLVMTPGEARFHDDTGATRAGQLAFLRLDNDLPRLLLWMFFGELPVLLGFMYFQVVLMG